MEIKARQSRGIEIIELHGKVVGEGTARERFQDHVLLQMCTGSRKFVVSLGDSPWLNSLGIGMLVAALASVRNRGGDMVLASATTRTDEVFKVTQLHRVFSIFDTVSEAVDYLANPGAAVPPGRHNRKRDRI
ncbi:MAG TPA: STAS domain-containing protein [Candidatus Krumholzibacteria bacterium]|nr:STAS domain-containing protein [Candidatus Krumholzibacteria bacterium]